MIRFAIATRDELWLRGRLSETRLSHGEAIHDASGITASDVADDALVDASGRDIARMRELVPDDARVRLVAIASTEESAATMTIGIRGMFVVTSPEHARDDEEMLRAIVAVEPPVESMVDAIDYRGIPIVWHNGSASVLLHEAAGHPLEHAHEPIAWPSWLDVDVPLRMRRETFRDIPLLRMTRLTARQHGAPFELPAHRIDVLLVNGGFYEPLTETVTLRIAAADYQGRRLPPFEIRESRRAVAQALTGAAGDPIRYPGVVCSREGQELIVGSFAPLMITEFS